MSLRYRRSTRMLCAALLGLLTALYADLFWGGQRPKPSDFTQTHAAARMLLVGENPYEDIGPGRAFDHEFSFFYPPTAAVVAMPFAWASHRVADMLFIGFGAALLAWSLTRHTLANPQLLVFASFAMMVAAQTVQWSPWLTAAALTPGLGLLLACKPSIGLAMLVAYPSRTAFLGCAAFALLVTAIWPWWIQAWWSTLSTATHMMPPVLQWGGPLVLLSLIKWRRNDARLLAALACVPQTPVLYEAVPLFLLVQTARQGALLIALMGLTIRIVNALAAGSDYYMWMAISGQWIVWLVYLPCTAMVLLRPNQGLEHDCSAAWPLRWNAALARARLLARAPAR